MCLMHFSQGQSHRLCQGDGVLTGCRAWRHTHWNLFHCKLPAQPSSLNHMTDSLAQRFGWNDDMKITGVSCTPGCFLSSIHWAPHGLPPVFGTGIRLPLWWSGKQAPGLAVPTSLLSLVTPLLLKPQLSSASGDTKSPFSGL